MRLSWAPAFAEFARTSSCDGHHGQPVAQVYSPELAEARTSTSPRRRCSTCTTGSYSGQCLAEAGAERRLLLAGSRLRYPTELQKIDR
jgi:hypothetical protein